MEAMASRAGATPMQPMNGLQGTLTLTWLFSRYLPSGPSRSDHIHVLSGMGS